MIAAADIPHYVVGKWTIDPFHSEIAFVARHMMLTKVRGRFRSFEASLTSAENPLESSVEMTIDVASIDTNVEMRDNHLRTNDFLDVENNPTITYRSTGVRQRGEDLIVDGDLTIRGVTKQVPLDVEFNGVVPDDGTGATRAGFSASTEINRWDFGVNFNAMLEAGGTVVGDKVRIEIDAEFILDT